MPKKKEKTLTCKKCGNKRVKAKLTNFGIKIECLKCGNYSASTGREILRFKETV